MRLIKKNWSIIAVIFFMLVSFTYIVVRGDSIYLQVTDYLDSHPAWMKMLSDNSLFWNFNGTVPFLSGIDRNYLYSDLKAYTWVFMVLPTFPAIICVWYFKIIISIAGFYALWKELLPDTIHNRNTAVFCGFLYGIIPTYPSSAFSFASLPLLLYFLLRLYRELRWEYIIVLALYPVFSDFSIFGIFICGYILIFAIADWIATKCLKKRLLLGLGAIIAGFLLSEWRLFYVMLFSGTESIRSTFVMQESSIADSIKLIKDVFVNSYFHCGSLHKYVVLPVCFVYEIVHIVQLVRVHDFRQFPKDRLNWVFALIVFNCIIYGIDQMQGFRHIIAVVIPPLEGFSFARTIWFNPFLWYFAFLIVLCRITLYWVRIVLMCCAFAVICTKAETYNSINTNLRNLSVISRNNEDDAPLTYREFYSQDLFDTIKDTIGYSGEWSVALGMHPSVLEYNGIATLDGYLSYYPNAYKIQFRKLIRPELDVDPENAEYYDTWGGRAYIFSKEIGFDPVRNIEVDCAPLRIDPQVFADMGGVYVFSRVEIENARQLGLGDPETFTDAYSPYIIYVYRMN